MAVTRDSLLLSVLACLALTQTPAAAAPATAAPVILTKTAPFVIELRLRGKALSAAQRKILQTAAERVAALIVSRYEPVKLDLEANSCDKGLPAIRERATHFFVYVTVKDLGDDIYGDAVPCDLHDQSYLPIYGAIDLNSRGLSDLSRPELLDTIIHELLHALGVGTLWTADERVSLSGESDEQNFVKKTRGQWTLHRSACPGGLSGAGRQRPGHSARSG